MSDHLTRGDIVFAHREAALFILQLLDFAHGGGKSRIQFGVVLFVVCALSRRGLVQLLTAIVR